MCDQKKEDINNYNIKKAVEVWIKNRNEAIEKYGHISNWDTSQVSDMRCLFCGDELFNDYIGDWDVSNVTNMISMFQYAKSFDQDIGKWNVSNVTDMEHMFFNAKLFNNGGNSSINRWDVSKVKNI